MPTFETVDIRVEQVSFVPQRPPGLRVGRALGPSDYVLQDISFTVAPGDRMVIVGATGAGKSSLLRLLNRLSEPTRGIIYVNNQALDQIPVIQLRQRLALVLQEPKLLGMTVQAALEYPLVLQRLERSTIQQRVGEWVERLHIPTDWLNRTELQLSVGQRQWVAIARALVMLPSVLLLDEPTSALDIGRGEFLLRVLTELSRSRSMAILMVNHQLELAEQFCDRVLHLQHGVIVQNVPRTDMDWGKLREQLIATETAARDEWGEP